MSEKTLRDEFALIFLPRCLADKLKGYGHIFDRLVTEATAEAYRLADIALQVRAP